MGDPLDAFSLEERPSLMFVTSVSTRGDGRREVEARYVGMIGRSYHGFELFSEDDQSRIAEGWYFLWYPSGRCQLIDGDPYAILSTHGTRPKGERKTNTVEDRRLRLYQALHVSLDYLVDEARDQDGAVLDLSPLCDALVAFCRLGTPDRRVSQKIVGLLSASGWVSPVVSYSAADDWQTVGPDQTAEVLAQTLHRLISLGDNSELGKLRARFVRPMRRDSEWTVTVQARTLAAAHDRLRDMLRQDGYESGALNCYLVDVLSTGESPHRGPGGGNVYTFALSHADDNDGDYP